MPIQQTTWFTTDEQAMIVRLRHLYDALPDDDDEILNRFMKVVDQAGMKVPHDRRSAFKGEVAAVESRFDGPMGDKWR